MLRSVGSKNSRILLAALTVWLVSAFFSIKLGAVSNADWDLVLQTRIPRLILASAVGMGLAVSGAVLQALFANPLCEPYTLGISSGSALGAVIGLSFGFQSVYAGILPSAFLGALGIGALLLLFSLRSRAGAVAILLSGVMLGFFCSSLVALWMALSDPNGIQGAIFWLMGDLSRASLTGALSALGASAVLIALLWSRWRELDAFLLGEEDAIALGVDVPRARRRVLFLVSLLIGVCVSSAGMIGFIGLIVPHLARRGAGALHYRLIPVCALLGAATLSLSDLVARVAHAPYELPAGVVTAIIGSPVFVWVMMKQVGGRA